MTHQCTCCSESPRTPEAEPSPARAEQTVADVAGRQHGALQVLKDLGINHCCGGHLTLREAAAAAGVPLGALLAALDEGQTTPA